VSLDRVIYCACCALSIFFRGGAFFPDTVYKCVYYLVDEAADCAEVRLRECDEDAGCTVDTDHRAVSSVKMIQRICFAYHHHTTVLSCPTS